MADVFTWRMDASAHGPAVGCLRNAIVRAHKASGDLSIASIFLTLPVNSPQIDDAVSRGDIQIRKDHFENVAADELWMQFDDSAMGYFYVTVPAKLAGSIKVAGAAGDVSIEFDPPIALEIPQLATLGVGRSSFQKLKRMSATADLATSFLEDTSDPNKETHIEVNLAVGYLAKLAASPKPKRSKSIVASIAKGGCGGGGGPEPRDSYVIRSSDKSGTCCFVHRGQAPNDPSGQQVAVYGPSTWSDCQSYMFQSGCRTCSPQ